MRDSIEDIARENREAWAGKTVFAIVEEVDGWSVHQHGPGGVCPAVTYPTERLAAARLLQLLRLGPVAPQTHPETACIGTVEREDEPA